MAIGMWEESITERPTKIETILTIYKRTNEILRVADVIKQLEGILLKQDNPHGKYLDIWIEFAHNDGDEFTYEYSEMLVRGKRYFTDEEWEADLTVIRSRMMSEKQQFENKKKYYESGKEEELLAKLDKRVKKLKK